MRVLKFGGTSVGAPERMRQVASIISDGEQKIVVLSAVSGTTNKLVELSKYLYQSDVAKFNMLLAQMEEEYIEFVDNLYKDESKRKQAHEVIVSHFNHLDAFSKDMFTIYEERAILAQGELISTALFQLYCEELGLKTKLLPALDFMRINNDSEPDEYYIKVNLERLIKENQAVDYYITQGYICRNAYGEIDNLKRGGSDYTASLIGAALHVENIQIWTDIDGMHNNDPRVVDHTKPIQQLSFNEAAELAYFGAKILHPSSVYPAQLKNIPVWLKNTMQPSAHGTLITNCGSEVGITAVAAKDGITAIKIKSGRMLMAYGFLRSVFEVFELYKTPIDMITTSEVAVSLTIDDNTHLDKIIEDLNKFGHVEIDQNQTIVCIVGDFIEEKAGYALQIFEALKEIPLRMVSYGGSKNNVSLLINASDKEKALKELNRGLFNL